MKLRFALLRALGTAGLLVSLAATSHAYDRMVVFGDSLSDNGNLALTLPPGFLSSLGYDARRFTSGPTTAPSSSYSGVAVEHLNDLLGLPALAPALEGGYNYAVGFGTAVESPGFDPLGGTTIGTPQQIAAYYGAHGGFSPDSLYVLWAGANDLYDQSNPLAVIQAEQAAMLSLVQQLTFMTTHGARNIAWFNLPDLSLTPRGLGESGTMRLALGSASATFRQQWTDVIHLFQLAAPDVKITGIDAYGFLNALIADPSAYGFTNVTSPALGAAVNPDEYVFWDDIHPTSRAHALFAEYAYSQLVPATPVPEANASIYAAMALLALVAYRLRYAAFRLRKK